MHFQTQSAQVFTIFGDYVLDQGDGEYLRHSADLVVEIARFKQKAIERKDQCDDWNHNPN